MKFNEHLEGKEIDCLIEKDIGEQENSSAINMC